MDLPKAPSPEDMATASRIWNVIVFLVTLIITGGLIDYLLNRRYVTREEWIKQQEQCAASINLQLENAILKNHKVLEERMVAAVSQAVKDSLSEKKEATEND